MDGDLHPIWEAFAQGRGGMEDLDILNQAMMRGLPSCSRVFGGRARFSASFPLLIFVKNVSLMNPYLGPMCTGVGGSHPGWIVKDQLRRPPVGLLTPPSSRSSRTVFRLEFHSGTTPSPPSDLRSG